jgi:hypothetical protein
MKITLDDLLREWEKDSEIDDIALDDETKKCAKLHSKYLSYLSHYKLKLKHLYNQKEILKRNLWLYYAGKMTQQEMDDLGWEYDPFKGMKIGLKSDQTRFIDSDHRYLELESKIEYNKTVLDTLEEIMNTLRWRHSHIKNMIDFRRFTAGG